MYINLVAERFQQLRVSNREASHQERDLNLKRKPFQSSPHGEGEEYQEYEEEEEEEYEDGEKTSYTSSTTTPQSRCSRGVSTDELDDTRTEAHHNTATKVTVNDLPLTVTSTANEANDNPKRFEDGIVGGSRNSVLLQLIACGSSAVSKAKSAPCMSNLVKKRERESLSSLHRVAVRKSAEKLSEVDMINYISENPRFGNSQSEEKEYFSGSLVESMKAHWDAAQAQPVLKKSNSYNEQRSTLLSLPIYIFYPSMCTLEDMRITSDYCAEAATR